MSKLFDKNISALKIKNPNLAEILVKHIPTEIPQLIQENGAYNLIYKGKYIHNRQNPLAEAREVFSMCANSPVSIHLVYGLGLGYLFQVASSLSKGTVILYEPDLNIIRIVFEFVDFSADILKQNIYFTNSFEDVSKIIYKKSGMQNTPEMLSLVSQREFDTENFDSLVKKLQDIVGTYSLNLKYTQERFYPALKMLLQNIKDLTNEIPLATLKNTYQGKTALVISAGPTLDRNIETIKKYRKNVVIITVGTALKTLIEHGIKPDFLCIIETFDSSRQLENVDLSDVNFITEPYSHPILRRFKYKNTFLHISSNMPVNEFWTEVSGESSDEYISKGTVSYTALNTARILGCSKIILVGQDLAYIEGQCYSKDSTYKDLSCEYNNGKWEITAKDFEKFSRALSPSSDPEIREKLAKRRLERLNNSLYYIKGINGDMILTESVYAAFVAPLSEFTKTFNDRVYINTSLVGAQIDGFENMSLENALQDSSPIIDVIAKPDFQLDKTKVFANIEEKLEELNSAIPLLNEGKHLVKTLKNDLKRYRNAGTEVLKDLKKLSVNYLNLSSDFTKKSKLFDFITTADKISLDYEMKMIKEFNYDNISKICEKMSMYYDNAENHIKEVERLINESLNSKG